MKQLVRTMKARTPILLLPVLLAACSLGPDYQAPGNPTPQAWRNPPAQASELWPTPDWWQGFGSPQLDSYITQAETANTDLAAAMARVREADAQARIAGAPLLPSVGLDAQAVHARQASARSGQLRTGTSYSPGLTASYELDFWGKNAAAAHAAEATAQASRYDQETVSLTILTSVATTYFRTLELHDRLTVAEGNLASARTTLDGLRKQQQAGIVTALDVAQQETVVATLDANVPQLRQQYEQALDALAILLGRTPDQVERGQETLAALSHPEVRPGLPSTLLQRRPDVAQAEQQLISANANIQVARAAFYPSIDLTADGGFVSDALSTALKPSNAVFTLTAALVQPIFEGGALEGQFDYAQARYDELLATYRKTVLSAFANVEDSLVAVQQSADQEQREAQAVATAQRAYDFARTQMKAGTINILTVLNTENALFSAQDQLVQAKSAHLQALVNLFGALGGGWQKA
jgi:NodT family efflux transporter outer membrane factor (OMF) lipoprotein